MPLIDDKVAQFGDDADLAHEWMNGGETTVVETEGGPVRSPAKMIADNQAMIDLYMEQMGLVGSTGGAAIVGTADGGTVQAALDARQTAAHYSARTGAASLGTYFPVEGAVDRYAQDVFSELPLTLEAMGAVGNGIVLDTALFLAALNSGKPIHLLPGKTYLIAPITVTGKRIELYGYGATIKSLTGNDTPIRLINCQGHIEGLTIEDVPRSGTTNTLATIYARGCVDLIFYRCKTLGGKNLPFIAVDSNGLHCIDCSWEGTDANRPFAIQYINCEHSTIVRGKIKKFAFGFTLIGPGYKELTGEYASARTWDQTLGMKVLDSWVEDHTGHAFDMNGTVGAEFFGNTGKDYTGSAGNSTFQVKQSVNAGFGENADDSYLNKVGYCTAINCVNGFGGQECTSTIFENLTVIGCKRYPVCFNSTKTPRLNGLHVYGAWGSDLANWPLLNGDALCAAVALWNGSDGAIVENLMVELLAADMANPNLGVLCLVNVAAGNCVIDKTNIRKDAGFTATLARALVISGSNCVIGRGVRIGGTNFYANNPILDTTDTTVYPLAFGLLVSSLASTGTFVFGDMPQRGMVVGKVVTTTIAKTGTPRYSVGWNGSNAGIVVQRDVPAARESLDPDAAGTPYAVNINLPLNVFMNQNGTSTGSMLVHVRGIPLL